MSAGLSLSVENMDAKYGGHPVLQDVRFRLSPGRLCVALGPNGAGKSTLVRAMLGIHRPIAGRILAEGHDVQLASARERARWMAWVPQHFEDASGFTVHQLVLMGRTPHLGWLGVPSSADLERCAQALRSVQMDVLADRPVQSLSGGEQRLALLARALAQDTPILLLDEPTAFLDVAHQLRLLKHLRRLAASGRTLFAVLHDLNLAAQFADDVLLLKEGRVVAFGAAEAVLTPQSLEALYEVPFRQHDVDGVGSVFSPMIRK